MEEKLYCIGVGPGDPELLTLKALRILTEVDAIAYPYSDKGESEAVAFGIVKAACENVEQKDLIPIHVPMTRDLAVLEKAYREAAEQIRDRLKSGKSVAYITLGDPMIYCTYSSLEQFLKVAGYETNYVPGVTSFCAAAAKLGVPLVEGKENLSIISASGKIPEHSENENLVFMKAGSKMKALKESDALSDRKIMAVSNCGLKGEAVYEGVENIPDDAGYFTIVIAK